MTHVKDVLNRARPLVAASALAFTAVIGALPAQSTSAAALLNRSMMVSSTAPSDAAGGSTVAGDPTNGAEVGHTYTFTTQTGSGNVQAITFQYCDSPFGYDPVETCTVPSGFSAAEWQGETVSVQENGGTAENWTASVTGTNIVTLENATTAFNFGDADVITVSFDATETASFSNPNTAYFTSGSPQKATYFAHIATHNTANPDESSNTTLAATTVDDGTVTNNITESISITTRVQETLNFSVEGEGGATSPTPGVPTAEVGTTSCDPLVETGALKMGDTNNALAADTAYFATSYFRLATNSSNGSVVYYSGDTLKSGANSINAIGASAVASTTGTEQFGLAIDDADASNDVDALAQLKPQGDYGAASTGYAFETASVAAPTPIAASTGVVSCDTGVVEYVANIAEDTEAGIYTTRINYIASPSY